MTKPSAVIFDIGNVLIRWDPDQLYRQLVPDDAERKALFDTVDLHGMNDRVDRGAPFRDTVYETADRHPQWRDVIRQWHDRWIEMARPTIDGSWHLLRQLRGIGVPVFALSNFGVDSFAYAETQYPELAEFDRRYISGHMRVIKPEPEIYEMVETDSGLTGDALFFTDDRDDNIKAAGARGWQAHRFEGPAGLALALQQVGLDVSL